MRAVSPSRGDDVAERGVQARAAVGALAQRGDEVDRGLDAGERLVALRAGLEAVAGAAVSPAGRTRSAGQDASSSCAPKPMPWCGPKNLYGEQISTSAPSAGDVDAAVRRVVHAVHPGQRADGVRDVGEGAAVGIVPTPFEASVKAHTFVRGPTACSSAEGRPAGRRRARPRRARRGRVLGAEQPRADVRVVVERGHDDLVAGLQRAAEGVHEVEVDRRHVGPEDDLLGLGAEEVGRGDARRVDQRGRLLRSSRRRRRCSRSSAAGSRPWRRSRHPAPASRPGRRGRPAAARRLPCGRAPRSCGGWRRCRATELLDEGSARTQRRIDWRA